MTLSLNIRAMTSGASGEVSKAKKRVQTFKTRVQEIRARRIQRFKQVLPLWEESFLKEVDELEQATKEFMGSSGQGAVDLDTENPFKKE